MSDVNTTEDIDVNTTEDIFDRIMNWPILRFFRPFYKKHKEALLYLLFGGLSFFLNLFLFKTIDTFTPLNALVNNVICWVVCVLFQFFTNRTWVFESKVENVSGFLRQLFDFVTGRLFTLVVEEVILAIFISWLGLNSMLVKLAAQVVVIVLNYVISKLWVFKDKSKKS